MPEYFDQRMFAVSQFETGNTKHGGANLGHLAGHWAPWVRSRMPMAPKI